MTGEWQKQVAWGSLLSLVAVTGCVGSYSDLVDPCYPQRYNCQARQAALEPLQTQAANGLAYEQTLYNYHFKAESDELLPNGQQLLARLAARRPAPDTSIYVQTANDVPFTPQDPEGYARKRKDLNERRVAAVKQFLKMLKPEVAFTVDVAEPSKVGIDSREGATAVRDLHNSATGFLPIQTGMGAGGAAGGGMGGGAGGGMGAGGAGGGAGGGR